MSRPKTISDEQILEAARTVFLEQGVAASTQLIAQLAGVSEALLFKRFKTKENLFNAAMRLGEPSFFARRLEELRGQGQLKANLVELCGLFVEHMRAMMPRAMMLWSARGALPPSECGDPLAARTLRRMTLFLDAEMRDGRLRPCDPEVVARAMLGALAHHVLLELLGAHVAMPMPDATFVRGLVESLWEGIGPLPARSRTDPTTPPSGVPQ